MLWLFPSVLWHCQLGVRMGIQPVKHGWWWRWALVSPDGVVPSRMVGVSASVNLPLHHEVQKFCSGTGSPGWSRKKGRKMAVVVWWWRLWQRASRASGTGFLDQMPFLSPNERRQSTEGNSKEPQKIIHWHRSFFIHFGARNGQRS